ncbi:endoglucanase E-4-like isoform X2 [Mercenaria mercenaria]|nr:endoglucanase E-4-like isoform X2 [Mercenaria mercenaria]
MLPLFLLVCVTTSLAAPVNIVNSWNGGFQGTFTVHADHAVHGWKAHLTFDKPVDRLEIWKATVVSHSPTEWIVENMSWDADLKAGEDLVIEFNGHMSGDQAPKATYTIEGAGSGSGSSGTGGTGSGGSGGQGTATQAPIQTQPPGNPVTSNPITGNPVTGNPITPGSSSTGGSSMKYDYGKALGLSILFYDAQRSGRLPANNPIPWRGDSAVNDNDQGHDLSGGWYDAGDHVKFNLPIAFSTWVLEWGMLKFKDGYKAAGQLDMACDMIKWPLEYFLKCWVPNKNTLYVQVGDGGRDHSYWGRPENMNMPRPAYKVTPSCKGSDVAGDTVSALAAGYLVFKDVCGDTTFASKLLTAAKSLYTFTKNNRGIYTQCVNAAAQFYSSSGEKDEVATAAAWMYKATQEDKYLNDAKSLYPAGTPWGFAWNDANSGAALLLYEATKDSTYKRDIEAFVKSYMPGGGIQTTPCGLAWRDQWGPNRYAGNAAFIAAMAAEEGIEPDSFKKFAMSQINYLLGDNKYQMSYEIGFGNKYPQHPHHRGSSCRTSTTQCSIGDPGPNPNVLKGGLVGGPDNSDNYDDRRDDYVKNEVACDYNAGFQSALAGLRHFAANNALPPAPAAKC